MINQAIPRFALPDRSSHLNDRDMEERVERGRCAACTRPGLSWHGGGPVLVVHSGGLGGKFGGEFTARIAGGIARDAAAHGVTVQVTAVTEVPHSRLYAFVGVVFVLPPANDLDIDATVAGYLEIHQAYRRIRPDGLAHAHRLMWYFLGAVIWVGQRRMLDGPQVRGALPASDAHLALEAGRPEVFHPLDPAAPGGPAGGTASAVVVERLFAKLAEWGISTENAHVTKDVIDEFRDRFDAARYRTINGRRDGLDSNLFTLVLDGGINSRLRSRIPAERWNSFMADATRACREVVTELEATVPGFHRPAHRTKLRQ